MAIVTSFVGSSTTTTTISITANHAGSPPGPGAQFELHWHTTNGLYPVSLGNVVVAHPGVDASVVLTATGLTPGTTYYYTALYTDTTQGDTIFLQSSATTVAAVTDIVVAYGGSTNDHSTSANIVAHSGHPAPGINGVIGWEYGNSSGGPYNVGFIEVPYPGANASTKLTVNELPPSSSFFARAYYEDSVQARTYSGQFGITTLALPAVGIVPVYDGGTSSTTNDTIVVGFSHTGAPALGTGGLFTLYRNALPGQHPSGSTSTQITYPGVDMSNTLQFTGLAPSTTYYITGVYTDSVQADTYFLKDLQVTTAATAAPITIGTLGYNSPIGTALNVVASLGGAPAAGTGGSVLLEWSLSAGGAVVGSSTTAYPGTDGSLNLPATGLTPSTTYYFTASYSDSVQPRTEAPEISVPSGIVPPVPPIVLTFGGSVSTTTNIDVSIVHTGAPAPGPNGYFLIEYGPVAGGPYSGFPTLVAYPGVDGTTVISTGNVLTPGVPYFFLISYQDDVQPQTYMTEFSVSAALPLTTTSCDVPDLFVAPPAGSGPASSTVYEGLDTELVTLCDDNGSFHRRYIFDAETGALTTTSDVGFDGAAYTTVGTVGACAATSADTDNDVEESSWCVGGVALVRRVVFANAVPVTLTWHEADGTATTPTAFNVSIATPGACDTASVDQYDVEEDVWCVGGVPLTRRTTFVNGVQVLPYTWANSAGALINPTNFELANMTIGACAIAPDPQINVEETLWCVAGITLTRRAIFSELAPHSIAWYRADGTSIFPTAPELTAATAGACAIPVAAIDQYDVEEDVWCVGGVPLTRRTTFVNGVQVLPYIWINTAGVLINPTNFELANMTIGACVDAIDQFDVEETVWCVGGVALIKRAVFIDGVEDFSTWHTTTGTTASPLSADVIAATPGACALDQYDVEEDVWCVGGVPLTRRTTFVNGVQVLPYIWINTAGVLINPTNFELANMTIGACAIAPDPQIDVEESIWCVGGVNLTRRIIFIDSVPGAITWHTADNTTATPLAGDVTNATPGACAVSYLGTVLTSQTFLIGGPTAVAGSSPDGATIDLTAWGIAGGGNLDSYSIVVVDGDAIATAASANRVELDENTSRFLSEGMSVSSSSLDGIDGLATLASGISVTALGTSRVLVHATRRF